MNPEESYQLWATLDLTHHNKRIMLETTEKGDQIYQTAQQRESFNRIMSRISPAKRRKLLQLLREVCQSALLEMGITAPDI